MANKLELTWYGKENQVNVEPRILIEDKTLSNVVNGDTENMLIHGDNLLALKALEKDYAGKIKCIYIDPPYNTGKAFNTYDDNVEHSIWLSLMRERLILLRKLLSDDGVFYVQINDDEYAYLKVLCDEVFNIIFIIFHCIIIMHSVYQIIKVYKNFIIKINGTAIFYYNQNIVNVLCDFYNAIGFIFDFKF